MVDSYTLIYFDDCSISRKPVCVPVRQPGPPFLSLSLTQGEVAFPSRSGAWSECPPPQCGAAATATDAAIPPIFQRMQVEMRQSTQKLPEAPTRNEATETPQ